MLNQMEEQQSMINRPRKVRRLPWFLLGGACTVFLFFLFIILIVTAIVSTIGAPAPEPVERGTVMEVSLGGTLGEKPAGGMMEQLGRAGGSSLWDVRRALERAKNDDRIVAVKLTVLPLRAGWASVAEMQSYVNAFRSSGKPIYAYLGGDYVGEKEYAAALGAEKILVPPGSAMFIDGLRAEVVFWRGTLDKLRIVPDVLALKEYKSAGETFERTEMSEPFRESLTSLLQDTQDWFVESVASRRSTDAQAVRAQINKGLLTCDEAKAAGWIDAVGYEDELEAEIQRAAGIQKYKRVGHAAYLLRAGQGSSGRSKLAVVFAEGLILAGETDQGLFPRGILSGPRIAAAIESAAKDRDVKAIVFRINSGGGSVTGSDRIWRAVKKARDAGKPIVASMSDVAGSGGYWIAMGADKIIAQPQTITGSIGIVSLMFNLRGFYELLGANVDDVTLADNAGMFSAFENLSEEQRAMLISWMEVVYEQFKQKVAAGRNLSPDTIENIAKGRVWSGKQALEHKLIDGLGGIDTAISEAKRLAGIPQSEEVELDVYPKPRTWFEKFFVQGLPVATLKGVDPSHLAGWLSDGEVSEQLLRDLSTPRPLALAPSIYIQ
jgi:protease-4